jgi:hypothetical protein
MAQTPGIHMPSPAPCPYMTDKEAWLKSEKGDLLHGLGHAMGRGRVSTQHIFSHFQGIDMSYRFK